MLRDQARMLQHVRAGKSMSSEEIIGWQPHWRITTDTDPGYGGESWARGRNGLWYFEFDGNLLTTNGANDLWTGLSTAGLSTPYSTTNCQLGVGDSSTAASAGQTDLQAAAGSNICTSGFSAVTNATPIVYTNGSGNWSVTPAVGSVVVVAGLTVNTNANGTFEVSASSSTQFTALNSSGNGVTASMASGTAKAINRYLQQANASGSAVVSTNQIVYVAAFGTSNANFAWQEFASTNAAATTNKQAAPPAPHMLNRAVSNPGTKASGTWTLTETITLT